MSKIKKQDKVVFQMSSTANIPISLEEARTRHIKYLEHGPYIYTAQQDDPESEPKILHSFAINQDDLELLVKYAEQGIRLHFCKEASGALNIIAAPIGKDGRLNLGDPELKKKPIVNTLEPCPSLCAPLFSRNSLNSWCEKDQYYWLDPNEKRDGKDWFFESPEGQKEYVNQPSTAPLKKIKKLKKLKRLKRARRSKH
ncbi:hypothetical protein [Taibaiella chishuiensis]|uniref:Uncharacterized protein n=1 Tax=Taibaiella chishuiensis TaxID=1434707 RepID=A0A2P8DAI3_9BACT|nr:hypothetical protein [Taibaiella chishuiensis]PSK94197.1 hypothetical protein B0I18_101352 [Taibaiella chishuiensis]